MSYAGKGDLGNKIYFSYLDVLPASNLEKVTTTTTKTNFPRNGS